MNGRKLLYTLPSIRAMVKPYQVILIFKVAIYSVSPCFSPIFGFAPFIPVGSLYFVTFILAFYRVVDFFAVLVMDIFLLLLIAPCSILKDLLSSGILKKLERILLEQEKIAILSHILTNNSESTQKTIVLSTIVCYNFSILM